MGITQNKCLWNWVCLCSHAHTHTCACTHRQRKKWSDFFPILQRKKWSDFFPILRHCYSFIPNLACNQKYEEAVFALLGILFIVDITWNTVSRAMGNVSKWLDGRPSSKFILHSMTQTLLTRFFHKPQENQTKQNLYTLMKTVLASYLSSCLVIIF